MTPYEVLGVEPTATQEEITKAYRAKSIKLHPDAGGDAAAFAELSHAYEILSDPEKRDAFDRGDDLHMEREVESTVAALISQAIDSNQANIIQWICDRVDRQRANHQNALPSVRRKISQPKEIAERSDRCNEQTKNTESRDFIAGCIRGLVANAERNLKSEEREIKLRTEILIFLNGIKYQSGPQSFQSLVATTHEL